MATILIADDEPFIARSLSYVLDHNGYETVIARDGEEALSKARAIKPDLIFLDLMMPRKNGYEVCKELRADDNLRDVPIILLTAKAGKVDLEKGLFEGADEYVMKPFSPARIVERTRVLLQRKRR